MGEEVSAPGWRVPLADVRLPRSALEAALEVLEGGWLSSGPRVEAFERELARYVGVEHAVACSSCTSGLELAFRALGVGPGDEVVMPSLSFVAGANVARAVGATPVFCDVIGEDDLTLAPESVERCIGSRTRAVVAMHYGGNPCSERVLDVARERDVAVVEDAAHALGAAGSPGTCGTWGEAGCFSFFANKNLPLGEGGMLVMADPELAERARRLRSHGMTSATWERHTGHARSYDVAEPGFNMRFDEARSAMGSVLLRELDTANERRGTHLARYAELLDRLEGACMPFRARPPGERSASHLAVVVLDEGIDRERVIEHMRAAGIQTSVHYPPTHWFTAHRGSRADVVRTEGLAPRLLTLPLYPHMEAAQVELVVEALAAALPGASS